MTIHKPRNIDADRTFNYEERLPYPTKDETYLNPARLIPPRYIVPSDKSKHKGHTNDGTGHVDFEHQSHMYL